MLWLALESGAGLRRRVMARRLTDRPLFADITQSVGLPELADVRAVISTIRAAEAEAGERCVLVVVDTVARALAGGDENDFSHGRADCSRSSGAVPMRHRHCLEVIWRRVRFLRVIGEVQRRAT